MSDAKRPFRPCAQERPCPTALGKCACGEQVAKEQKEAGE